MEFRLEVHNVFNSKYTSIVTTSNSVTDDVLKKIAGIKAAVYSADILVGKG